MTIAVYETPECDISIHKEIAACACGSFINVDRVKIKE